MDRPKRLTRFESGHGFSREDWDEVSDNPEWTAEDFANAKPFAEIFPEFAAGSGIVLVPLDADVARHYAGPDDEDLRKRVNTVLRKAAGL